jgi:hypothetical protein
VSTSPLSPEEIRAAAEVHRELGPDYQHAVLEAFIERVGREIDARVDARLAQRTNGPPPQQADTSQRHSQATRIAIGSMAMGIPLSGIAVAAGTHPTGIWGLLVIWIAIAVINVAYAIKLRQPGGR